MEFNKKTVQTVALAAFAVLGGYWCLQNLSPIGKTLQALLSLASPFLLGCAIAFILNVPMRAVERHLGSGGKRLAKLRRPVAFMLTLALVAGVLALAGLVVVPNLGEAASSVAEQAQSFFTQLPERLAELEARLPELQMALASLEVDWTSLSNKALEMLQSLGKTLVNSGVGGVLSGVSIVGSVVSGVSTFVIGLVFAIYLLLQKEKLGGQVRQCLYALLPERVADRVLEIAGGADTFQLAWQIARPNAIVSVIAMYEQDQLLPLPQMYGKNLTFKTGGVDGVWCDEILRLIAQGKIDAKPLITHRFSIDEIAEAYRLFEQREDHVMKVAVTF